MQIKVFGLNDAILQMHRDVKVVVFVLVTYDICRANGIRMEWYFIRYFFCVLKQIPMLVRNLWFILIELARLIP